MPQRKPKLEDLPYGAIVPVMDLGMDAYRILKKGDSGQWSSLMDMDAAAVREHGADSQVVEDGIKALIEGARGDEKVKAAVAGLFDDDCYWVYFSK